MNKKTQMYLGIGVLAVAAYYFWNKSKTSPKANVAGKGINYRKAGSICHYMYGDEYMVGRVNSYNNNICEGTTTRGVVL